MYDIYTDLAQRILEKKNITREERAFIKTRAILGVFGGLTLEELKLVIKRRTKSKNDIVGLAIPVESGYSKPVEGS